MLGEAKKRETTTRFLAGSLRTATIYYKTAYFFFLISKEEEEEEKNGKIKMQQTEYTHSCTADANKLLLFLDNL